MSHLKQITFTLLTLITLGANTPQTAAQTKPSDWLHQGIIKANEKNYTEALSNFTKAIEINPQYAEAYYQRGLIYTKYAQTKVPSPDGASPGCQIIDKINTVCEVKTAANWRQQKKQQAVTDFTQAISIKSQYAAAYYQRGLAQETKQNKLKDFEIASKVYLERSIFNLQNQDYKQAAETLEKIDEIYANIKFISATSSTQQELENPITSATKSPELQKDPEEMMKKANQALNKGDTQNSLRLYKLAAQIFQERKSPRVKEVQQIINALEGKK